MVFRHFSFLRNSLLVFLLVSLFAHFLLFYFGGTIIAPVSDDRVVRPPVTIRIASVYKEEKQTKTSVAEEQAEARPAPPAEKAVKNGAPETTMNTVEEQTERNEKPATIETQQTELDKKEKSDESLPRKETESGEVEQSEEPVLLGSLVPLTGGGNESAEGTGTNDTAAPGGTAMVAFELLSEGATTPKPTYPEIARRWGHEGVVVVRIYIDAEGSVEDAVLLSSSGHQELDNAALEIIRKRWNFQPTGNRINTVKEFEFQLRR